MVRIGAHDREGDPLTVASATGSEVIQFFLGDPQGWGAPTFPGGDAGKLRAALSEAGLEVFIHAPYGINVASANNRIRIPSRKLLSQQLTAAAAVGAKGLIVHGGHVTAKDDPAVGVDNWRKTLERAQESGGFPLPILIENTAGGDNAMARRFDRLAMLWDAVGEFGPGFVLDTCHAWAGGEELADIVARVTAITGRVDLVHANNSRDTFDSGADRHANFDAGTFDSELIAGVCRDAGCDVIVETPADGQRGDLEYLHKQLD